MENYKTTGYSAGDIKKQNETKNINQKQEIKNKLIFIPIYGIISLIICTFLVVLLKGIGILKLSWFGGYYDTVTQDWQISPIFNNIWFDIYAGLSVGAGMKMTLQFWKKSSDAEEPKLIARKRWDDSYEMSYEKSWTWNIVNIPISALIGFISWIPYYIYLIYSYITFKKLN